MRERNDHMTLIKPLGKRSKVKWKNTLRQMFRYAKRHEEKRDIEGVNSSKGGHMAEPHVLLHEVS